MVSPDVVVTFASALPLLALGALVLGMTPRRSDQLFFGLFALAWGANVALVNVGLLVGDPAVHRIGLLAAFALLPPASLFLVHFASRVREPVGTPRLSLAVAAIASGAALVLVVDPSLVIQGVGSMGGLPGRVTYGPVAPLFSALFFGAFYLALVLLYSAYRRADPGTDRRQARGLFIALAIYVSYAALANLIVFLPQAGSADVGVSGPSLAYSGLFLVGTLVVGGLAVHRVLSPPHPEGPDRVLVLALLGPAAWALAEPSLAGIAPLRVASFGLARLAAVALLVYVLARYHLFDLDLRLRRLAGPGLAALAATVGLGWGLLAGAGTGSLEPAVPPALAGLACAGAAFHNRGLLGRFLFPHADDGDYLKYRRLEVYREHLHRELAGPGEPDEATLAALRDRLGVSDREHWALEYMVAGPDASRTEPGPPEPEGPPAPGSDEPPSPAAATGTGSPGADETPLGERYDVIRVLGEGAHGRALLAHDHERDHEVVLKTVTSAAGDPGARKRLLREADLLGEVDHPNVVRVLEASEHGRAVWLVLEYVEGGSLDGLLRRRGRLGVREGTRLLDGVLAGLEAAHDQGIVHRDVKPGNVLLTQDGSPRLTDFGVAVKTGADVTQAAAGAGTLLYMSPEQVRGDEAGPPADVYSAGVLLHQVLAGEFYLPLQGRDDFQVRRLVLEEPPRLRLPDGGRPVEPVLERALAKDPSERYEDAGALRAALAEALPAPGREEAAAQPVAP